MNYLIVDDEPIAHKIIQNYASDLSSMKCVGNCYSAIEAAEFLKGNQVDLIFLDIQMPKLKGFDLIRSLKNPPLIIIISAHKEFALESYDYDIVDYLLKPFNFERFFKAVQKAMDLNSDKSPSASKNEYIFIKDEKIHHKVALSDIVYIEASGNYSMVYLEKTRILTLMKISDFESLLPKDQFTRVHRSYIISNDKITLIKASEIHLGGISVPVGRVYKNNVRELIR